MKTPITYYGGKQRLLKYIIPLIPKHTLYAEPFTGGGAVFFAKEPSEIEVLNDTNRQVITFYEVAKSDYKKLKRKIDTTLHSKESHAFAKIIYDNPRFFGKVDIAWSVWVLASCSFASMLGGSFGYDKVRQTTTKKFANKKDNFTEEISKRLENAEIECRDAVEIIRTRDTKDSFFYCDPPYFNADMGHYKGYTEAEFERLLKQLSKIQGKFLLSSYPSEILADYVKKNGWHTVTHEQGIAIHKNAQKVKVEVLTANYPI
jgi:DNA adenine methylase